LVFSVHLSVSVVGVISSYGTKDAFTVMVTLALFTLPWPSVFLPPGLR